MHSVNFAIVDAECGLAFLAARSTSCHAGSTARTRAQPLVTRAPPLAPRTMDRRAWCFLNAYRRPCGTARWEGSVPVVVVGYQGGFQDGGPTYGTDRHPGLPSLRCAVREQVHTKGALRMDRRTLLKLAATSSLLSVGLPPPSFADPASTHTGPTKRRVRPGDPDWPSPAEWNRLKEAVGGAAAQSAQPFLHRRPALGNAKQRLGRCLGIVAERLCSRSQRCGRHCGRGQFRS